MASSKSLTRRRLSTSRISRRSSLTITARRLPGIFRQAAESEIATAAYAVNQGRTPGLRTPEDLLLVRGSNPRSFKP